MSRAPTGMPWVRWALGEGLGQGLGVGLVSPTPLNLWHITAECGGVGAEAGVATQEVATQGDACLQQEMLVAFLGGDVAVAVEGSRWLRPWG